MLPAAALFSAMSNLTEIVFTSNAQQHFPVNAPVWWVGETPWPCHVDPRPDTVMAVANNVVKMNGRRPATGLSDTTGHLKNLFLKKN